MKHIRDAQKLLDAGDGPGTLAVVENLLELAPKNVEALRLKARVLDGWGQFEDSLNLLRRIAFIDNYSDESMADLEARVQEEREALVFSELAPEGRWYFAFPRSQIWISLYGFFGCASFLLLSTQWLNQGAARLQELLVAFVVLVVVPWVALSVVHFSGVKKVLVGLDGIRICKRFNSQTYSWKQLSVAVIEYDRNLLSSHLKLILYSQENMKQPLLELNISEKNCVVRARRHFVRCVLSYMNCVTYRARQDGIPLPAEMPTQVATAPETPLPQTGSSGHDKAA
jgi:hypothetical protein